MAKSTAKLKRISPREVGAYMRENGLSSMVAVDDVEGWPYRIYIFESGGKYFIGAFLIICDETTDSYNIVNGSGIESVTKVRNLPCDTRFISKSSVEGAMSNFFDNLITDTYMSDEVQTILRTDSVDGSELTYDDLNVSALIIDE